MPPPYKVHVILICLHGVDSLHVDCHQPVSCLKNAYVPSVDWASVCDLRQLDLTVTRVVKGAQLIDQAHCEWIVQNSQRRVSDSCNCLGSERKGEALKGESFHPSSSPPSIPCTLRQGPELREN